MMFSRLNGVRAISNGLPVYKCLLLGEAYVGKSSYLMRIKTGEFLSEYKKTKGVNIAPLIFHTDRGSICLNVWDVGVGGINVAEYCTSDCAIVMCDLSSELTNFLISDLRDQLIKDNSGIPTVLVGNKKDALETGLLIDNSTKIPYCEMTVKGNRNIIEPFRLIVRKLFGDNKLKFVNEFAPWPKQPSVEFDEEQFRLPHIAYILPLPEDDNW